MDPGVRSPLVDFFRRGEVARDVRLLAARGAFAPRALEQLAILLVLLDDADAEIATAARATVDALPQEPLAAFLGRTDIPSDMRDWFAARGVVAVPGLARNPKTPVAISLHLLNRLTDRDAKMMSTDRNIPEPVRLAARRRVAESASKH